jgi:soluble lytic murein transglycosylase-like protein
MPATAAETAVGLKMPTYSLTNPEDNLRIGMAYYGYMLARFGNKPMRAMFAYNAGPSRMRTWNEESGELPDDILLEALHLSQTRQYGKNIVQATLAYAKIHYGIDPDAMLDYLVYAKPLPPAQPVTQPATQLASEPAQPLQQTQMVQPESAQ